MSLEKANFDFLAKLKGNELVSIDKQGKLVTIEKTSSVAQNLLQKTQIQEVAEKYIEQATWEDALSKIDIFAKSKLVSPEHIDDLIQKAYDKKVASLLQAIEDPSDFDKVAAEAIVVSEMAFDTRLSENVREKLKPELSASGRGGTYFLKNRKGEKIGVFKPQLQEPGMPLNPTGNADKDYDPDSPKKNSIFEGHIQGSGWMNEIAAFLIDGTIGVPDTMEISLRFPVGDQFMQQKGSFQIFINDQAKILMNRDKLDEIEPFEIQKIALFDILTSNCDRHLGNLFLKEGVLIPIDHGLAFRDEPTVWGCWLDCSQLKVPIDNELKKWILNMDIDDVLKQLADLGLDNLVLATFKERHAFLVGEIGKGKTLHEIASQCRF